MPPGKIYVELSSACNLDCATCFRRSWTSPAADMAAGTFAAVAAFVRGTPDVRTVVLGGIGEPTRSPFFVEALEAFGDREVVVTTNGVDLPADAAISMARSASLVVFSIDGLDPSFRRIRGRPLEDALSGVRRLLAARGAVGRRRADGCSLPELAFQFVLEAGNAAELRGVVGLAADLGVGIVHVSHLLPQDAAGAASVLYGRREDPAARALFAEVRAFALRRGVQVFLPRLELKTERRCAFVEDGAVFATAEGAAVPCYRLSRDGTEYVFGRRKAVFGKAFGSASDLGAAWESEGYREFRRTVREGRYPSCPDCDLVEGCDLASDTEADCWSSSPSCADCLWARGFLRCP